MFKIRLISIIAICSLLNCSCMKQNSRQGNSSSQLTKDNNYQKTSDNNIAGDSLIAVNNRIINDFGTNLAKKSRIITTSYRENLHNFNGNQMTDENLNTYWSTDDSIVKASIVIDLIKAHQLHYILLSEYIPLGERITGFTIDAFGDNGWELIAEGNAIGKLRIINLEGIYSAWLRINIINASASPAISEIAVY